MYSFLLTYSSNLMQYYPSLFFSMLFNMKIQSTFSHFFHLMILRALFQFYI